MAPLTTDDAGTADGRAADAERDADHARVVTLAEELLTRRHGATVRLADPVDLGGSSRSVVVRVRVAENPFSLPRTLVLKHYLDEPGAGEPSADRFRFEAASCQLLTAMPAEDRASPMLVANDPAHRLLVLEDLGRCSTLADRLDERDPKAAERALLGWARALGRMQAATAGREHDFGALLRRFGVRTWRDPLADDARAALAEVPDQLAQLLRVEAAPAGVAEARTAVRLLGGSGYRAFSPAEIRPDNCLLTGSGARFLDFEWGCFRDVALTAASLCLPLPSGGRAHAQPPGMAEALVAAWQAEITPVWTDLADAEVLRERVLQAEVLWVWLSTRALLPAVVGTTPAGRAARVVVADPGEDAPAVLSALWRRLGVDAERAGLVATAELAAAVVGALGRHGGEAVLAPYPAFA
ncbi:hypothetical protein [Actinomycetospora cinnamomea]|uniref:Phosphotransferase family enzyme n=1 Tax=Actinomycetospora cinnamomea TaxID=663609 RepID=A0A2U1FI42_9PSEU|nr:hypothetical protein [Actinomycetospora cinnamomea]PVZ11852.1 hypothetical protein C8D89_103182 [Actinomycetospora cinnamomea]